MSLLLNKVEIIILTLFNNINIGDNMSRLQRNLLEDCCCHITHRCHNRSYHFRFKSERNDYRSLLIEMSRRYKVSVFDYIITSNHIHLIVNSRKIKNISDGMRFLQGATAQRYNRKTKREGAFWRDRYHITLIQNGVHLRRCIFYIDFNMIRTGKISHPSEWHWSGYDELSGNRKRYRVIDFDNLLQCTGVDSAESFINWYNNTIEDEINKTLVEFKLAKSSSLKRNLEKQLEIYKKASDAETGFFVIIYFTRDEYTKATRAMEDLGIQKSEEIILVDARDDNKPSGSKA